MPLKDLFKVARQKKISLKGRIEDFLATQAKTLDQKTIKLQEAKIEQDLAVRKATQWRFRDADSRKHFIHPSSLMGCARTFCYKFLDAPVSRSWGGITELSRTERIFSNGDYFHLRMQVLMVRMGLCNVRDIEVGFSQGDEEGTADAIIRLDGVKGVVDFKSANEYAFNAVRESSPDYKYEMQLRIYMEKFGVKFGIILYENKNTQHMKEVVLLRNKMKEDELRDRRDYLRHYIRRWKLAPREGKTKTTIPCSRCDYRALCYSAVKEKEWLKSWRKAKRVSTGKSKPILLD